MKNSHARPLFFVLAFWLEGRWGYVRDRASGDRFTNLEFSELSSLDISLVLTPRAMAQTTCLLSFDTLLFACAWVDIFKHSCEFQRQRSFVLLRRLSSRLLVRPHHCHRPDCLGNDCFAPRVIINSNNVDYGMLSASDPPSNIA